MLCRVVCFHYYFLINSEGCAHVRDCLFTKFLCMFTNKIFAVSST